MDLKCEQGFKYRCQFFVPENEFVKNCGKELWNTRQTALRYRKTIGCSFFIIVPNSMQELRHNITETQITTGKIVSAGLCHLQRI